ncbi:hypothetical protein [Pseudonocardia sp. ICBG601]|uniref:hypothetical protein n=1 Tax=Pseudonocardia sp. ICBG601 TaxID=2846759 RepID=UPI001CF6DA47|nr:hypothetical protein [Pseudonocardia sp. ICBG601]
MPDFSTLSHLECSRTGEILDADTVQGTSGSGAPLLARYDLDRARTLVTRPTSPPARRTCGATTRCCPCGTPRTW